MLGLWPGLAAAVAKADCSLGDYYRQAPRRAPHNRRRPVGRRPSGSVLQSGAMKAVILAGGFGTRLRPLTLELPKPIVPIFDRPFLYYQTDLLRQIPQIDEVVLSLNYRPDRIEARVGNGTDAGVRLRYVVEPDPLGTGGAIKYAAAGIDDTLVVLNGDVLTGIDLQAVVRRHRERAARATIVLTPVDEPSAYGVVETDDEGNVLRFLEKPSPDQITCDTINAGIYILEPETFDRIPDGTKWSIERQYFPLAGRTGRDLRGLCRSGVLARHRHSGELRPRTPRPDGATLRHRSVRRATARHGVPRRCLPDRRERGDRRTVLPWSRLCRRGGRPDRRPDCAGLRLHHRPRRGRRAIDSLARHARGSSGAGARRGAGRALPHRTPRGGRPGCGARQPVDPHRAQPHAIMTIPCDADVFKAYDVRGLYPGQINEPLAELIGRGFVAHLGARRIAVSRDMRLSSPALACAFIDGARTQGADVVDIGLMGTDQLYYAVARDGHDGGAQITASHNPGEYNGIKLVGREAIPLSGDAGISDIRDMLLSDAVPAPAALRGGYSQTRVFDEYVEHVLSFIDQSTLEPTSLVLDAGSGIGGLVAPALFDPTAMPDQAPLLRGGRLVSHTRGQSAA